MKKRRRREQERGKKKKAARRKAAAPDASSLPSGPCAMLALRNADPPDGTKVCAYHNEHWPEGPRLVCTDWQPLGALYELAGEEVAAIVRPLPLLPGLRSAFQKGGPFWPDAENDFDRHLAHLGVLTDEPDDESLDAKVRRAVRMTRIVAAFAATASTLGVCWGLDPVITRTDSFLQQADLSTETRLPILCWIGFSAVHHDGREGLLSRGMRAFRLREILVLDHEPGTARAVQLLCEIAHYTLRTAVPFEHGDTVSTADYAKLPVRVERAGRDREEELTVVDLPSPPRRQPPGSARPSEQ
ncbi:DUF4261 domain-containing protein [bacterium]|nr:DUF4261 domain-containing protein [bacterium]